jgi:hypothetical protein
VKNDENPVRLSRSAITLTTIESTEGPDRKTPDTIDEKAETALPADVGDGGSGDGLVGSGAGVEPGVIIGVHGAKPRVPYSVLLPPNAGWRTRVASAACRRR